jgi:hypothetical protein
MALNNLGHISPSLISDYWYLIVEILVMKIPICDNFAELSEKLQIASEFLTKISKTKLPY